jgi:hypothetical protein
MTDALECVMCAAACNRSNLLDCIASIRIDGMGRAALSGRRQLLLQPIDGDNRAGAGCPSAENRA